MNNCSDTLCYEQPFPSALRHCLARFYYRIKKQVIPEEDSGGVRCWDFRYPGFPVWGGDCKIVISLLFLGKTEPQFFKP